VDITTESGLAGQFMVTHLPSIFHIHEGEVRSYEGKRTLDDLQQYIEREEWREVNPMPWWKSPTAGHMKALGVTYWLSQKGRELQTMLEDEYELPTYTIFIIIAVATIVIGLGLGGITVCCIEMCFRVCPRKQTTPPPSKSPPVKPKQSTPENVGGASDISEQTDAPSQKDVADDVTVTDKTAQSPSPVGKKARKRKGKKARQEE
jgi:hypothetical protein